MAYYHNNLKHHEDKVAKRKINKEDVEFLKELQKELNTQDNCGTASPRYWTIKGSKLNYGVDIGYADDWAIKLDCETVINGEDLSDYLEENIDKTKFDYVDIGDDYFYFSKNEDEYCIELCDEGSVLDFFERFMGFESHELEILWYREEKVIYENLIFLTEKEAENHLRLNHYHYSEDAHTYCMQGWRSPAFEQLINLLQEIDFEELAE